jgi:AAA+ ATPase superfamily predicted ATPase
MYFDLAPKERRSDLYDFEEAFEDLKNLLSSPVQRNPLIVVKGLRRTGKTSLIRTCLNELALPYLYIDGRRFAPEPVIKKRHLLAELERGLNELMEKQGRWRGIFREVLSGIRWIRVSEKPPFVHFEWRKPASGVEILDLVSSFQHLAGESGKRFVLVIDEAQEFSRLVDYKIQPILAYIYDNRHEIQMIVSGSQVGLLNDFLGAEDLESPLFGRGAPEVALKRLSVERATEFLTLGCKQAGIQVPGEILQEGVNKLGGVMGWLTLFGYELSRGPPERALEKTLSEGSRMEASELEHFLRARERGRRRYLMILKAAARLGEASWADLKANVGRITDKRFCDLLRNLVGAGFLGEKDGKYFIADPLLSHALRAGMV